MDKTWLCHIERGDGNPSYETLYWISAALSVSLSQIIKDAELLEEQELRTGRF